ncbi:HD domain-containing phosphohydrolase [Vibrio sp. TRT 17S01]|uniref:HD-GYP domain-containing protein n=1 Tax=Vibrio sp. TRT 17S01 TaxID=3418505 RepID=UPI003CEDD762
MEATHIHTQESFSVDLKHALIWVARALDYVGIDDANHGHRVAYIAYECAKQLGWEKKKQEFCFMAGLLHDCGVSQSAEHKNLVSAMTPNDVQRHCRIGYQSLSECELLIPFANIVLYHHTPWAELESIEVPPFEKDIAALIFLADRLDFLRARFLADQDSDLIILKKNEITGMLNEQKGKLFRPDLVETLAILMKKDGFWYSMVPEHIENIPILFKHLDWLQTDLSLTKLVALGRFIAGIVDAKSPFTYQHSLKVAELSEYLANKMHLPTSTAQMLYVSGLVHDIGKLRTPDEILHKPGKLTMAEYAHIKKHTIDTEIALNMVFPDSKIGDWAVSHHERLDGSGYPYNKTEAELDLPSRIIAIADIFQALSQQRPYRERLNTSEINAIMQPMIDQKMLDPDVYQCLKDNIEECFHISVSEDALI